MHALSPTGKSTICNHAGTALDESSSDLQQVDCLTCLWGLVRLLLMQWGATLQRLQQVERSKTTRGNNQ